MTIGMIGRKVGMTRIFTETGDSIPVTVLDLSNNRISQIKTGETDGYSAVQIAYGHRRRSRINKAKAGHLAKAGVETASGFLEFRVGADEAQAFELGQAIDVSMFETVKHVDISGVTKGKGFAGAIKRHHFSSQRASHGQSITHNAHGSTGMNQDPGRVFKGKKMAGHLGSVKRTIQNLEIVKLDKDRNLVMVKGSVPGADGSNVVVATSVKKGFDHMELKVINESGQSTSALSASDALFGRDYNESLIHQIVNAFLANRRQGTRAQKARGDLTRSHKKPWRQRELDARVQDTRAVRSGEVVDEFSHLVRTRTFLKRSTEKMYRAGISSILSQLVREDRLLVVESFSVDAPKTKVLSDKFKSLGLQSALVITDAQDDNLYLSSRNLAHFDVVEAGKTDPIRLLQYEKVVVTKAAIAKLEEVLS